MAPLRQPPIRRDIGATGLEQASGYIMEDFLHELRGQQGYKRYNEMRLNSPIIGGLLLSIEQAIRSIKWTFTSDTADGIEDPRIELLNQARAGMVHSWNDHIVEALTMLPFGYAPFAIIYKREGGRMLWHKLKILGQNTVQNWIIDDSTDTLQGLQQLRHLYPDPIPIERMLLYRTRSERDNPEGRSILRTAWVPYYYTKHIQQIEAIAVERDMNGLPMIILPEGADTEESDSESTDYGRAASIVRRVRNDEQAGLTLPHGWEFRLVASEGSRDFDTDKIIKRYESRMLISALAQFLMLGQDGVGSLALSSDQTDFFTMSVNAVADIISETFTKHAIPRLLRLNGMDVTGVRLEHSPAGDVNITAVADFLQKTGAYVTWTADDEVWLRSVAKLPERDPQEIAKERDANRAADAALLAQISKRANQQKSKSAAADDDEVDESTASGYLTEDYLRKFAPTHYASAPDDATRQKAERRWGRVLRTFFNGQKDRVLEQISK